MQKSETKYSKSKSIYNVHMKHLGTMKYREIKAYHMQECIDKCNRGYSTQSAIKTLWGHLDNLALELDISNKKYSTLIHAVDEQPETTRDRFSNEEIIKIWEAYHDYKNGHIIKKVHQEILDTVLIFLYTGYRISELTSLKTEQIDLNQKLITHGIKTAAGKGRIIPIHSKILPLVEERYNEKSEYFLTFKGRRYSTSTYRAHWHSIMNYLGIDKTVHETRHTLESILDSERANKKCIDLLMGHASKDVGNRVYNHKTIAQLRETIELMNI